MSLEHIKDIAHEIYFQLGHGHPKETYMSAFTIALEDERILYERDKVIPITFRNRFIGSLYADMIVERQLILKLSDNLNDIDQCKMYKRISQLQSGIVIVFSPKGVFTETC